MLVILGQKLDNTWVILLQSSQQRCKDGIKRWKARFEAPYSEETRPQVLLQTQTSAVELLCSLTCPFVHVKPLLGEIVQ